MVVVVGMGGMLSLSARESGTWGGGTSKVCCLMCGVVEFSRVVCSCERLCIEVNNAQVHLYVCIYFTFSMRFSCFVKFYSSVTSV